MRRLLLLDRDGVINVDSPDFITSPDAWQALPGSLEALASMHAAGIEVAVATNQSAVARGLIDVATLNAIHERMRAAVAAAGGYISSIAYCPHGPEDGCGCRKPQPGLLQQLLSDAGNDVQVLGFVGDSLRDLQAAVAAGVPPILVRSGNGRTTERELDPQLRQLTRIFDDLTALSAMLVGEVDQI